MSDNNSVTGVVYNSSESADDVKHRRAVGAELMKDHIVKTDTWRHKDYPDHVVFTDHGHTITSSIDRREVVEAMLKLAETRGWEVNEIEGTERFNRHANEYIQERQLQQGYSKVESEKLVKDYKQYGAEAVEANIRGDNNQRRAQEEIDKRIEQQKSLPELTREKVKQQEQEMER